MGRPRIYANTAERVRAYRSRKALLDLPELPKSPKSSGPVLVQEIEKEVHAIRAECETWLANLPASIKGTVREDLLLEAIEILTAMTQDLARVSSTARP